MQTVCNFIFAISSVEKISGFYITVYRHPGLTDTALDSHYTDTHLHTDYTGQLQRQQPEEVGILAKPTLASMGLFVCELSVTRRGSTACKQHPRSARCATYT